MSSLSLDSFWLWRHYVILLSVSKWEYFSYSHILSFPVEQGANVPSALIKGGDSTHCFFFGFLKVFCLLKGVSWPGRVWNRQFFGPILLGPSTCRVSSALLNRAAQSQRQDARVPELINVAGKRPFNVEVVLGFIAKPSRFLSVLRGKLLELRCCPFGCKRSQPIPNILAHEEMNT